MKKLKAIVSGKIWGVGYRARVIAIAKDFKLTGAVQNLDDGRVGIIAEGDEDTLNTFLGAIRIKDRLIDVDDVEIEYADVTGDFDDFYKLVKDGDIDDPLDKCIMYLKEMLDVMKVGFGSLNSKMDVMIEKPDETTANSGRSRANST